MQVVSSNEPLNVLFLCTGNSPRSIMAEVVLNRLGRGKFKAYSAGSQPAGAINPIALQVLHQAHYDTSGLHSKSWDEFAKPGAPKLDFVFTVCDNAAEEVCPIWPGQPMTAHWGLPDPVKAQGSDAERHLAFADALRMLTNRIGIFVSLPFDKLSKLSLQKHFHRSEHWVVVKGTAEVTLGTDERSVHENESIYIPIGSVHRLANPGKIRLELIEVQVGSYLGEDDIQRLDDTYGRG